MPRPLALLFALALVPACSTPPPVPACTPTTCDAAHLTCGDLDDGCGNKLSCGTCAADQKCENGACVPSCVPQTCAGLSATCGSVSDGCGGSLECGTCQAPFVCSSTSHKCICTPKTCVKLGLNCGTVPDGCGKTLDCGTCSGQYESCGAVTPNLCGCAPDSCGARGFDCGPLVDGCGKTLNCGACGSGKSCVSGHCVCVPKTCGELGATCGTPSDGCGGTAKCGTCSSPLSCGAAKANVCGVAETNRVCSGGFCWVNPYPQGWPLRDVFNLAAGDVWAVGDHGTAIHLSGGKWTATDTGTTVNLRSVWASGPDDVWASGEGGTLLHRTGGAWSAVNLNLSSTAHLWAVGGTGPTDVWVAGEGGIAYHLESGSWVSHPAGSKTIRDVHARAANDVWFVGDGSTAVNWNGTAMVSHPVPGTTTTRVEAVFALTQTDAWAGDLSGALYRWNGFSWSKNSYVMANGVAGLFGTGSSDVWAMSASTFDSSSTVARFSGTSWSTKTLPSLSSAVWRIHGSSTSEIWGAGNHGQLVRWDGTAWTLQSSSAFGAATGLAALDGSHAFATGFSTWRYDGGWSPMVASAGNFHPMGVAATSPSDVWIIGYLSSGFSEWGALEHFDGTSMQDVSLALSPTTLQVRGVWSTTGATWIVGDSGTVRVIQNGSPYGLNPGTTATLNAVFGFAASEVWMVGESGTAVHVSGSSVTRPSTGITSRLNAVWGASASDVWAVGDNGVALHWTGSAWKAEPTGVTSTLYSVGGKSASDVWALTGNDTALHWNGTAWSPGTLPVRAAKIVPAGTSLWLLGGSGEVLVSQ